MKLFVSVISLVITSFFSSKLYAHNAVKSDSSVQNFLSWGVSYAHSDATIERLGLMFSTSYTQKFYEYLHVEMSLHYVGSSLNAITPSQFAWSIIAQHSLTGDLTPLYSPFQTVPNIRIGLGPSVRLHNLLESYKSIGDPIVLGLHIFDSYSFGANAKIDYGLPISENIEVVFRAQAHLFLPAFTGYQELMRGRIRPSFYPNGGSVSLGAFLRIGF
jgi:hypothetical protein